MLFYASRETKWRERFHISIYRLEKEGVVIFLPLIMVNSGPFDHDLTVERGKQQAARCIYCKVGDSEVSRVGHN